MKYGLVLLLLALLVPPLQAQKKKLVEFYCPMDTQIVRLKPGACPECGMALVKRKAANDVGDVIRIADLKDGQPLITRKLRGWTVKAYFSTSPEGGTVRKLGVEVTAGKRQLPVAGLEVWFHTISPSGRNLMPILPWNGEKYETAADLPQSGIYTMMVHVNKGSEHRSMTFRCEVP
jgi:hypothetical protein